MTLEMNWILTGEFNGGGQLDQGDVIADAEGSPFRVDGVFGGPDFNAGGFLGGGQTDIVGAQVNVEKDSGIGTVWSSERWNILLIFGIWYSRFLLVLKEKGNEIVTYGRQSEPTRWK